MILLVDTNVLLDGLQTRQPFYSLYVWELVEQRSVRGLVSMISFNNVFYVLRKQLGAAAALASVQRMRSIFGCVAFDEPLLDQALMSTVDDLEDAIQAAAVNRSGADYVVTRNMFDFTKLGVQSVTPQELRAMPRA